MNTLTAMKYKIPKKYLFRFFEIRALVRLRMLQSLIILIPLFILHDCITTAKSLEFENPSVTGVIGMPQVDQSIASLLSEKENDTLVQTEKLLRAICLVESNCDSNRIGDGGNSYGAFQIHLPSHPDITKEQAMNYTWAKDWTLNHCKKYVNDPALFAKCHNGIAKTTNQWYVDRVIDKYNSM